MRVVFKKSSNYNNIHLQIHENFNITLNNFDYNKDDYYTSLNENILIPLSNFISNYIILVNDFFEIKENLIFDNSIITTISYLEVSLIQMLIWLPCVPGLCVMICASSTVKQSLPEE